MDDDNEADIAQEAWSAARRFATEEKYEEALERHLWFHNHALETRRSYYGVRLSFALTEWIALGEEYPKAISKLEEVRDTKTARLLGGEECNELFHDVVAINSRLDAHDATILLFERIEQANPDFASSIYHYAEDTILHVKNFTLARKYLGDPTERFSRAQDRYTQSVDHAAKQEDPEALTNAFEKIYNRDIVTLITILDRTGDSKLAKKIQSKALGFLATAEIESALPN